MLGLRLYCLRSCNTLCIQNSSKTPGSSTDVLWKMCAAQKYLSPWTGQYARMHTCARAHTHTHTHAHTHTCTCTHTHTHTCTHTHTYTHTCMHTPTIMLQCHASNVYPHLLQYRREAQYLHQMHWVVDL